ncbi:hypothetical protein CMUS01_00957 [Colletotrichum musicola]|uniref:Uncharacterized protein n=1 Tax=Colletotrichum musicola TaxID=2175873 RepID=A0A8H6U8X6_9PEZI|nr:hypothetical protein CMUS01_00957 [Colletotrichum musicola]
MIEDVAAVLVRGQDGPSGARSSCSTVWDPETKLMRPSTVHATAMHRHLHLLDVQHLPHGLLLAHRTSDNIQQPERHLYTVDVGSVSLKIALVFLNTSLQFRHGQDDTP